MRSVCTSNTVPFIVIKTDILSSEMAIEKRFRVKVRVDCDREDLLAAREIAPIGRVGFFYGGESGVLPNRLRL